MGLDIVELVMTVESSFGVSIPDRDAADLRTVGALFDYLKLKCDRAGSDSCATSAAFYQIRRAIVHETGAHRGALRPDSSLSLAFEPTHRRESWARVARHVGRPLRPLVPSQWLVGIVLACAGAGGLALGHLHGVIVGCASTFLLFVVIPLTSRPFWKSFPAGMNTLGDLARTYARDHFAMLLASNGWNDAQAWEVLREIVVEQLGVRPDQVTRDAHFVDDLGAG